MELMMSEEEKDNAGWMVRKVWCFAGEAFIKNTVAVTIEMQRRKRPRHISMFNWEELITGYELKNDAIKSKTAGICSYYWVKNKDKSTTYLLVYLQYLYLKGRAIIHRWDLWDLAISN